MSKQRTVRLDCGKPTQVLYVLGTVIKIDIYKPSPPGCRSFEVTSSPGVNCSFSDKQNVSIVAHHATRWALTEDSLLLVTVDKVSSAANDGKVKVTFYGDDLDKPVDKMTLELTAVYVSLDVDADRDGVVEQNNPNKSSWMWGPKGHGAVLLVNCDKERSTRSGTDNMDDKVHSFADLADMSRVIIRTEGPKSMPAGYTLNLHISPSDKEKVQLFRHDVAKMTCVLGRTKESTVMDFTKGSKEINFSAEGLAFPDNKNATLVTFNLSVVHQELPIFADQVVFHFAPWIMTPNTQAPEEVFVCSVTDNKKFLIEFKKFVNKAHCKLTICPEDVNLDDVWMQDEIEFGYTDAPHKFMNIVLDSPRNRGLKNFAYNFLLGPDFGRIDLTSNTHSSLNSFGNLEVSPPVTVNGKEYPLGRIVIGSHLPIHPDGRKMAKVIKDLLMAQSVQSPIILYSDWLTVGHVDEFMSFVPAPDRKVINIILLQLQH
ncbi:protein-arginine deiminase type-2-like [Rhinoraja longicauda]